MRWKYGRFGRGMELVSEKEEVLGQWIIDHGAKDRIGKLWLRAIEREDGKEWMDEVV